MGLQEYLYRAAWFAPFRWLLSGLYAAIIWLRNAGYDLGLFKITSISTPVISVGNITVGGSGKTVLIQALIEHFSDHNLQSAVLSRGFGRQSKGLVLVADKKGILAGPDKAGDEPFMIAKNYPGTPVVVSENRILGAHYLESKLAPDVILLDDGFQHRKLDRNLDIVIVDSPDLREEKLLPRGRLREPRGNIKRADVILFSKAGERPNPDANLHFELSSECKNMGGETIGLDELEGPLGVFAGIGNPHYFFEQIAKRLPAVQSFLSFPDHTRYGAPELQQIRESKCKTWVTTQKDMVKLPPEFCHEHNVFSCSVKTLIPDVLRGHLKHHFK